MITTNKIMVNGVQLAYTDEGSGATLIFLHGFPLSKAMWHAQAEVFRATHRVITFDWRGFGESELGDGPLTIEQMADDLSGLMEGLKIESAVICGLSMGGYVAFAFYKKHPQKVAALILADTKPGADSEEARRGRFEMADKARGQGAATIADAMIPKLLGETAMRIKRELQTQVRQLIEANNQEAIARTSMALAGREDSTEMLTRIACPTLILCGSEDVLTPPIESEKRLQAIAGSKYEVINGAGHLSNLENTKVFNTAVENFFHQL